MGRKSVDWREYVRRQRVKKLSRQYDRYCQHWCNGGFEPPETFEQWLERRSEPYKRLLKREGVI